MKKLIFEIQLTGHHSEYIRHLVDYLELYEKEEKTVLVVHPELELKFNELYNRARNVKAIELVSISKEEWDEIQIGGTIKRSFTWFSLACKYALEYKCGHLCLLYFNVFQIALIFKRKLPFDISGVLFLQFSRMSKSGLVQKVKYYRKYWTTKLFAANKNVKKIYVLNDDFTSDFLNKEFSTEIFETLNDPVPKLMPNELFNLNEHYNISSETKVFLHIGSLNDRKGTFEIVESAQYISTSDNVVILLVGKINDEQRLYDSINKINKLGRTQVLWDNQFVNDDVMKSLFDQCDGVLIPYKNAEASSGILGHAARANKPVIATNKGLLKDLVEKYNLGILVDRVDAKLLAAAIREINNMNYSEMLTNQFLEGRTTENFASKIFYDINL